MKLIVSNSAGSCVNNGLEAQQAAHLSGGGQMATVIYMNENRVEKTAMKSAVRAGKNDHPSGWMHVSIQPIA